MAVSTARITEMPLRSTVPLTSYSPCSLRLRFLFSATTAGTKKSPFSLLKSFSSLRTTTDNPRTHYPWDDKNPSQNSNTKPKPSSSAWLDKWPSSEPPVNSNLDTKTPEDMVESRYFDGKTKVGTSAIERIVLRLRNLGLGSDDEDEEEEEEEEEEAVPVTGDEKLGDLLSRDWVRPDKMLVDDGENDGVLPWERLEDRESEEEVKKKRTVKAPTLAELTIEDSELRRLRRLGMVIRERISVPKAGVTGAVLEKIHDQWRKSELVRLKFHESLAHDMKTAHEIVEVG